MIGYGVAAVLALFITEWLIHLPGLDFVSRSDVRWMNCAWFVAPRISSSVDWCPDGTIVGSEVCGGW